MGEMCCTTYNHVAPPNTDLRRAGLPRQHGQHADAGAAVEPPPRRRQHLLGDGSVRFIKRRVALPTWRALGTRNGGEVISAESY